MLNDYINKLIKSTSPMLLISMPPTPNGGLHLGHVGGPFLKMDIMTRSQRQMGGKAFFYSGVDSFDSYVLLESFKQQKSPEIINEQYYSTIKNDLSKMHIGVDMFINPLDGNTFAQMQTIFREHLNVFSNNRQVLEIEELYPHHEVIGALPPSFIKSLCPTCNKELSGFICESCNSHFNPSDLESITTAIIKNSIISYERAKNLFISIDKKSAAETLQEMFKDEKSLAIATAYLNSSNHIRLTLNTDSSIAPTSGSYKLYNYTAFFPYCLTIGEICKSNESLGINPFDRNSNIKTACSYGYDNTCVFINSVSYLANLKKYKFFDYCLPNNFYTLDGAKFSTSRNHAVWVSKLSNNVSIDIVRMYLAKNNCDNTENNFSTTEFIAYHNKFSTLFSSILSCMQLGINIDTMLPEAIVNDLLSILAQRAIYVSPENFCGTSFVNDIEVWLEKFNSFKGGDFYWWLKSFAIISYPVLPHISTYILNVLGHHSPTTAINEFIAMQKINLNVEKPTYFQITNSDLYGDINARL